MKPAIVPEGGDGTSSVSLLSATSRLNEADASSVTVPGRR
jgi:hypothetical protein